MIKILALSIGISTLPLSQKSSEVLSYIPPTTYTWNFKNNSIPHLLEQKIEPKPESADDLKQGSWYNNALQNIEQSEYQFKWDEKLNAYCTPNRKNNLRFFYNEKGFSVEPRTTKIPFENYEPIVQEKDKKYKYLPSWKVNFKLDKKQVGKGTWAVTENKAEYNTDKITVEYINTKEGMRQNFIVHAPLLKADELKINLSIKTNLKTKLNGNQLQFFHQKTNVLNYKDLKVWDANNKPLSASFHKKRNGSFYIQVDAKDAFYPITIDPISTGTAGTPDWLGDDADQVGASFGTSVASAGDVNGDGYSDVIIGAPRFDEGASFDEGKAFVYHGSATGLSLSPNNTPDDVNQTDAFFGSSVASAGDVNGDGYSDVIIGAFLYNDGFADEGAAFVYHGSAAGLLATPTSIRADANQLNAAFGRSVACAGDVNGDGYSDVIIGADQFNDGPNTREGRAYAYYGSAAGISATPSSTLDDCNQIVAYFGYSVASAGDVNGDGYSDVVIGAYSYDEIPFFTNDGKVYVYHGSAGGLSASPINILDGPNENNANLGISVACAGDVNGDGYSDVIAGAPYLDDGGSFDEGAAFIYFGSASGSSALPTITLRDANQAYAEFGISVASAGDVNGDGYSDVIIGADLYDDTNTNEGVAYMYYGNTVGTMSSPVSMLDDANQDDAGFGSSVASAGDVNGDGYSDVIIGAYFYTDGSNGQEGIAFVYHGSPAGISTITTASLENNQASANYGNAVSTAGDVNGDGFSDIIIASQYYDNGSLNEGAAFVYLGTANGISTTISSTIEGDQIFSEIGSSVSTAGDINADGYSDIIIGARYYDNGEHLEGGGLVFYGSPSGINTSSFDILEVNQPDAFFGYSVASAGDVNGDGYGDIIAGAYSFDAPDVDEGAAFIFLGSSTGISLVPSTTLQSNQASASFGYSVAGAGDVNGDGYSDVIVGAYNYTNDQANEGVVFIFLGSASGTSTTYSTLLEHNQSNAAFGYCVSGAGDVNGDGFSDIAIGSIRYSSGQTEEGAVFVYAGSISGINTTPIFTAEGDQNFAEMGNAIGNAGDVNGDGYSDLIIGVHNYDNGQSDEGKMLLYYGSTTGLSITNVSSFESNQTSSNMGRSVNSAGDVNGDGYSDILAGAPFYDNGETDEGFVFLLQGNPFGSSLNKRNNLRLYNADLTTPLNNSNFLFGNFGAGLYAKSFLGRDKGKLVWETRLNYNPYSGTPITNSTFFTSQQAAYTNLGLAGVELKNIIPKLLGSGKFTKLRARVKYDPVTAITGQVYGPWRNVSSIIDANFIGVLPITLISFNVSWQKKGSIAKIDFVTDKEAGTCCFDIQKSMDGFNFNTIGSINAKNTSGRQTYSFLDDKATNNKQFYRLKIKGTAGQLQYSNIQQLQNDKATEILVFPNPTANVLQLQLNKNYTSMNVQIVNALGQVVKQYTNLSTQNQTLQIPVKALANGNYWLHLQGDGEKQVLQFVKQ